MGTPTAVRLRELYFPLTTTRLGVEQVYVFVNSARRGDDSDQAAVLAASVGLSPSSRLFPRR